MYAKVALGVIIDVLASLWNSLANSRCDEANAKRVLCAGVSLGHTMKASGGSNFVLESTTDKLIS